MDSLSAEIIRVIKTISINDAKHANIVGSFRYVVHEYPADIDLIEEYTGCCTLVESQNDIVKAIQKIPERLRKLKLTYLGDFKAGMDKRYDVQIGEWILQGNNKLQLVAYNPERVLSEIKQLYEKRLLNETEFKQWNQCVKPTLDYLQHKKLSDIVRAKSIVRWSFGDIEKGYVMLPKGVKLTLKEAVTQKTVVKIDVYSYISGRFVEVNNWFILKSRDAKGKDTLVSKVQGTYIDILQKDIAIYSQDKLKKRMKLAKRLWLLAIYQKNEKNLIDLYPLFSSGAAKLSQIQSDIETMINMIDKLRNPPLGYMRKALQDAKLRMGSVLAEILPEKKSNAIIKIINSMTPQVAAPQFKKNAETLYEMLNMVIDHYSLRYLKNKKLI